LCVLVLEALPAATAERILTGRQLERGMALLLDTHQAAPDAVEEVHDGAAVPHRVSDAPDGTGESVGRFLREVAVDCHRVELVGEVLQGRQDARHNLHLHALQGQLCAVRHITHAQHCLGQLHVDDATCGLRRVAHAVELGAVVAQ